MHLFPARLHVLLASRAPVGLVIRRGPSKQVATIRWDRLRDEFHLGQWFKGRIYERRCDLSPDGEHFLYFAMNGKWHSEAKGAWTAISRAPYLKALSLYPKGDCWNGGGLWKESRRFWLNGGAFGHEVLREAAEFQCDREPVSHMSYGSECTGVYYPRLLRDGWHMVEQPAPQVRPVHVTFEKPLADGWILRKTTQAAVEHPPGHGCYWDEHELRHPESDLLIPCRNWEWADVDGSRLVWAGEGRLFSGKPTPEGVTEQIELFDFNPMKFEPIVAPY